MIDSLRVFSFLADHPPQRPPQQIAIHAVEYARPHRFLVRDTSQRCAGANLQKRHNLLTAPDKAKAPRRGARWRPRGDAAAGVAV